MYQKSEIIYVTSKQVKCEGESEVIGHPLIYFTLDDNGEATCSYCSKLFKLQK
jgi:uncharacterized Zn-finger protein